MLAGTTWGASPTVMRSLSLVLCFSDAEYCAPVWARSGHTSKVDTQLNQTVQLSRVLNDAPSSSRLRARRPFFKSRVEGFDLSCRGEYVEVPTKQPPDFDKFTRKQCTVANRLRTRHGRTKVIMHRWGLQNSAISPI